MLTATLDIREFTPSSWRHVIGVVPQDPILFTGTIASNIAYGNADATREQIEAAAREANCEFVWGMPHGFDTESASSLPSLLRMSTVVDTSLVQLDACPSPAASGNDWQSRVRC